MKIDFDLGDLNRPALERLVRQLLTADEAEEKKIMASLADKAADPEKESNDLADLKEEKRGKVTPIDANAEPTRRKRNG